MNLHALRLALLVAEAGSFAAAARRSDVDPSSVSRLVAGLEAEIGVRLFHRSTRRLSLTEEGRIYLDRVAPLLDELAQAQEDAAAGQAAPRGWLRLTASTAFGTECVVPLLPEYRRRFPEIRLELVLNDGKLDLVGESLDLALRLAPAPDGDLISTRLADTRYRVVASPGWLADRGAPRAPAALSPIDCLRQSLDGYRDTWRFQGDDGAWTEVPVSGSVMISAPLALREAARNGLGPALLADWLVRGDLASRRLVDLFPDHAVTATTLDTGVWALYPSRAYLPAKTRVTIDYLREALA